jgi:hypothetical protein
MRGPGSVPTSSAPGPGRTGRSSRLPCAAPLTLRSPTSGPVAPTCGDVPPPCVCLLCSPRPGWVVRPDRRGTAARPTRSPCPPVCPPWLRWCTDGVARGVAPVTAARAHDVATGRLLPGLHRVRPGRPACGRTRPTLTYRAVPWPRLPAPTPAGRCVAHPVRPPTRRTTFARAALTVIRTGVPHPTEGRATEATTQAEDSPRAGTSPLLQARPRGVWAADRLRYLRPGVSRVARSAGPDVAVSTVAPIPDVRIMILSCWSGTTGRSSHLLLSRIVDHLMIT